MNRGQTAGVAGTIRRGETEAEDGQLADELLHDAKNLQEHAYVVETIVDRLGDVADLTLPDGPQIMKNPQVQHLYTPIAGKLRGENTVLALAERLHPTPALGGRHLVASRLTGQWRRLRKLNANHEGYLLVQSAL